MNSSSVCVDPEESDNPILKCEFCEVRVHALCYGVDVQNDPIDMWLCSPCKIEIRDPQCVLCKQTTGAMKKTTCGNWVHVICALFTEGVNIEDTNDMEPINLSRVSNSKRNKTCAYCMKTAGFCSLCSKGKCTKRIHITCAQRNNCTIEIKNNEKNSIDFRAYCADHKPSKSKRRVSSKFVRGVVSKKYKSKGSKHNKNADWIIKATLSTRNENDDMNFNVEYDDEPIIPVVQNTSDKSKKAKEHRLAIMSNVTKEIRKSSKENTQMLSEQPNDNTIILMENETINIDNSIEATKKTVVGE